jgi:hypothetical protein
MDDTKAIISRWLRDACESGQSDPYRYRRSKTRFSWNVPLELLCGHVLLGGQAHDLSGQGVAFTCECPLPANAQIHIRRIGEEGWVPIRVTHCKETSEGFIIGGRFDVAVDNHAGIEDPSEAVS